MNVQFKKIKKRYLTVAIVKSVICGVAFGLFAAGAVLMGLKLAEIDINAGFYVLIGLVPALLSGGAVFIALRPTDKKTAKLTDEKYGLNEKVQTMVAFSGKEGEMLELQCEDASEKLAALPKEKFDIKKFWHYILISVLSVALFVTAVALPRKAPPEVPEIPFTYTERQKLAVEQLVSDVGGTSLSDDEKASVAAALTAMSESLVTAETQTEMRAFVFSAVALVDVLLYTSNSFDNVAYVLQGDGKDKYQKTEFLGAAMKDGVLFYSANAVTIISLDQVKKLENGIANSVGEKVDMDMDVFVQQYSEDLSPDVLQTVKDVNEIMSGVSDDEVAPADDAVRVSVENFLNNMKEVEEACSSYGKDDLQSVIRANINEYKDELVPALMPQSYRCVADEFVRRRTAQIFDINPDDLPKQKSGVKDVDDRPDNPDGDDGTNQGGVGPGDKIFGSSEYIYDPDTGELTVYGKVFSKYYASMTEQLFNGTVPENLQESIKKYFDVLYTGTLPKPDEENKED